MVGQQVLISGVAGHVTAWSRSNGSVLTLERLAGAPALGRGRPTSSRPSRCPGRARRPHRRPRRRQLRARRSTRSVDVAAAQPDAPRRPGLARRRLPGRPADLDRRLVADVGGHGLRRRGLHASPTRSRAAARAAGCCSRAPRSPPATDVRRSVAVVEPKKVTATGTDDPRRRAASAAAERLVAHRRLQGRDGRLHLRPARLVDRSPSISATHAHASQARRSFRPGPRRSRCSPTTRPGRRGA